MTSEQRRVVLTLGFCGLVSAADNWFVSPALPAIAQTLAAAPSVVAVILAAYLVPYGALQPVCGAWIREIPGGKEFDPFRALARTIQNHREFIFNYWDCSSRISNGYTERANRLINETDMRGRGYSFETLRARTLYRRQNLDRIIASNGLTIAPRVDAPGPLFVTEPDRDGEALDKFMDPRSGARVDATTGEIL